MNELDHDAGYHTSALGAECDYCSEVHTADELGWPTTDDGRWEQ